MPYSNKPTVTATETEFLLFISPQIKERAKVVRGYRWDPERRCWVYPRTKQVWDALVAEFGEELGTAARVKAVAAEATHSPASLQSRIDELEQENAEMRQALSESIDEIVDADLDRAETEQAELLRQRDEARSQLAAARALFDAQMADLQREARAARAQHETVKDELTDARNTLARLQTQLVERSRDSSLDAQLKQMALDATGNDTGFGAVLGTLDISNNLALRAGRLLEDLLRTLLNIHERDRSADLYDLIQQAADSELLPRDAIDMAHLIRRQRNVIAHAEAYEKTYQARSVLCLFAIALLWPELPELGGAPEPLPRADACLPSLAGVAYAQGRLVCSSQPHALPAARTGRVSHDHLIHHLRSGPDLSLSPSRHISRPERLARAGHRLQRDPARRSSPATGVCRLCDRPGHRDQRASRRRGRGGFSRAACCHP